MPTKFINELNFDKKGYDSFDRNPAVIGYINDVAEYAATLGTPNLEFNASDKTVWNNGQGNIASNTSFGDGALKTNTTGQANTAFGQDALSLNTTALSNTAIGSGALRSNTAAQNTAVGAGALYTNIGGVINTAVGTSALSSNTTGSANSALGSNALTANIGGSENTAIGQNALANNTTGASNTAVGYGAVSGNFSGSVILGKDATATAANQFVVGSVGTVAGTVVTSGLAQAKYWNVIINGVAEKILLG